MKTNNSHYYTLFLALLISSVLNFLAYFGIMEHYVVTGGMFAILIVAIYVNVVNVSNAKKRKALPKKIRKKLNKEGPVDDMGNLKWFVLGLGVLWIIGYVLNVYFK